jgi:hypothetical protein
MPELTQFDKTKSTIRNFPAKGTAGLARHNVKSFKRDPRPPARIIASVFRVNRLTNRRVCEPAIPAPFDASKRAGIISLEFVDLKKQKNAKINFKYYISGYQNIDPDPY